VSERDRATIRRFYDELWNGWNLAVADEILADDVRFRGSLGATLEGREAFKGYVERIRAAFPDWHNRIDELIDAGDTIVARMTWIGTRTGELFGMAPTGQRVSYVGVAIFRLAGGVIQDGWVVGDTQELWRALGGQPAPGVPRGSGAGWPRAEVARDGEMRRRVVLAYVFWHASDPSVAAQTYEEALAGFHGALRAVEVAGFTDSLVFRLDSAPWGESARELYEDWYLLEGWSALGAINETAVAGARAKPHAHIAAMAVEGAGAVYRLRAGSPALTRSGCVAWFAKPSTLTYAQIDSALEPLLALEGVNLWQRQLALGPAPEFCLHTPSPVSLPRDFKARVVTRTRV
jgi:predicted ester cyclase